MVPDAGDLPHGFLLAERLFHGFGSASPPLPMPESVAASIKTIMNDWKT